LITGTVITGGEKDVQMSNLTYKHTFTSRYRKTTHELTKAIKK